MSSILLPLLVLVIGSALWDILLIVIIITARKVFSCFVEVHVHNGRVVIVGIDIDFLMLRLAHCYYNNLFWEQDINFIKLHSQQLLI